MNVAVAIITDPKQNILITQRPSHVPHSGMWEFPGGKLEANETADAALIREIKEEVGLDVIQYEFLTQIDHDYPDKRVSLLVYHVYDFRGQATCLESQHDLRWVSPSDLGQFTFPEANERILHVIHKKIMS
ncbi:MAG: 8-oxo-dGTP diphosphatase MutT [Legionellaceae bacterium]|nr:8-oxo-dGTP diphosphatase MutT [Legionellaceae bacterium]